MIARQPSESRPDEWTIAVDGAARGNPGPAAAGICIFDAQGRCVRRIGRALGVLPNNRAEYQALIFALTEILPQQPAAVLVRMDSELVVRQMTGQYRVKDPVLQTLYAQAQALLRRLPPTRFQHVPRSQNAEADQLANLALDGKPVDESPIRA